MKRQIAIPRQMSLITPEILNPFVHKIHLSFMQKIQIVFMSLFVVPIRLLMIFTCLIFAWMLAKASLAFRSKEEQDKPMKGWRKTLFHKTIMYLGRAICFFYGFQNVKVKGQPVGSDVAPMLVCAPHSTFMDAFVIFYCSTLPSSLSRKENSALPILGSLIEYTQPLYVQREDPNSRKNIMKEMTRRAKTMGEWPQIIIFPEGTCTNRSCLIGFKQGAFYPGVPVQPVCIRYLNSLDTYTWTWEGPGAFTCLWLSLCQFHNKLELEFLPVYNPNEEEKQDPTLYASNVRQKMAESLKIPFTDHTYDDVRLMQKAAKLNLPHTAGLIEFQKLHSKLGISFDQMNELLDQFGAISQKDKGSITLGEFAAYLHVPVSPALEEMFSLYDRNGSETIDFREYIIGLSLISQPVNNDDTLKLAFQLFDNGDKGYITQAELTGILTNAFGIDDLDVEKLFQEVDINKDDKITFDEFRKYAETKPEYAKLFMTYQELKKVLSTNGNGISKLE
ncbi:lysophosphatidylcholine acyltransferase 2-like isoform X1 [Mytilus californianus]|uniref:lysophosphatidylcholine acyltransferase 2-like isoform X1 n=2 Tax=Mytilus californianus TaxID=6549 RepID=UPI0022450022|nr:lysophosphatidylcholine acyltransferase 2-like isoform X1 [Mytilus californianus]